jgi:hypothetical protein
MFSALVGAVDVSRYFSFRIAREMRIRAQNEHQYP